MIPVYSVFKIFMVVAKQLDEITASATREFSSLSQEQLNWKPDESKWSIAQCLDHLIISNSLYHPVLETIVDGSYKSTLWQKISPFTGFIGKQLVKTLASEKVKMGTPKIFTPSNSKLPGDIVDQFTAHQEINKKLANGIATGSFENIVITSPVAAGITLRAGVALDVIVTHEQRHYKQARRIKEMAHFPDR